MLLQINIIVCSIILLYRNYEKIGLYIISRPLSVILSIYFLLLASCSTNLSQEPQSDKITLKGNYSTRIIIVEIADEPSEHRLGLMHRNYLPSDRGMLFVFPEERERFFWMHETHISLDIIFLDSDFKIVNIVRRAKPDCDDSLPSGRPSKYVLEVEAGLCDRIGLTEGMKIDYEL